MVAELALTNQGRRPDVLRGMEGIRSHWDTTHSYYSARVMPGEFYVTQGEELITTVLGSCIAVCIRDTQLNIGGMNHFMRPKGLSVRSSQGVDSMQYGVNAMDVLINTIVSSGGSRNNMEVKIFGGANVLQKQTSVGEQNIEFVKGYLREQKMYITKEDLGGRRARKIIYFPFSGRTLVKRLQLDEPEVMVERDLDSSTSVRGVTGEVKSF